MSPHVLVCGEAIYDVFLGVEDPGGFALDARIGGSAFNVALGLARLGERVGLLTGVSTDALGEKLAATLRREGVDTGALVRTPAPTTLAMVSLGADGSAEYQFYGEGAADRQVSLEDLPAEPAAANVFGCFSLLTKPTGDSFLHLARSATGLNVLDPNVRPSVTPDMEVWRTRVEAFAAEAGLVKASADDLELLYGVPAHEVAARWLAGGTAAVAVTRGGEGASLHRAGGTLEVPAETVNVVDTVGAGDSFLAALISALSAREALTRDRLAALGDDEAAAAMAFAARAAAVTCTRRGADLPGRGDLA